MPYLNIYQPNSNLYYALKIHIYLKLISSLNLKPLKHIENLLFEHLIILLKKSANQSKGHTTYITPVIS